MTKEGLGLEITELRLGLPGDNNCEKSKKRVFSEIMRSSSLDTEDENGAVSSLDIVSGEAEDDSSLLVMKSQAVGWPPVCCYRKKKEVSKAIGYVKVSMDGVPYLRKIDLDLSHGYDHLATVLENLFGYLDLGVVLKESEKYEYITIYEDKDRDWMLVGDVPWMMFKESCKRLRIVKRSDATGFGLQQDSSYK